MTTMEKVASAGKKRPKKSVPEKKSDKPKVKKKIVSKDSEELSTEKVVNSGEKRQKKSHSVKKVVKAQHKKVVSENLVAQEKINKASRKRQKKESESSVPDEDSEDESDVSDSDDEEQPRTSKRSRSDGKTKVEFGDDVDENKTIFIRNLDFNATSKDVKFHFGRFGEIELAILVKDKKTNMPKGSAFVKFSTTEECDKTVENFRSNQAAFMLNGRQMIISKAIAKSMLNKPKELPSLDSKRSNVSSICGEGRNLHLAVHGMIKPGSEEEGELPKNEFEMRRGLIKHKEEKLKDPKTYISPFRLCIRNLPVNVNDKRLREICTELSSKTAVIKECRIMRDPVTEKSLGFAFLTFKKHDDAMNVLRKLNNNRNVFKVKAPIVEFSIENMRALEKKKRRMLKSQSMLAKLKGEEEGEKDMKKSKNMEKVLKVIQKKKSLRKDMKNPLKGFKIKRKDRKRHNPRNKNKVGNKPKGKISRSEKRKRKMASYE